MHHSHVIDIADGINAALSAQRNAVLARMHADAADFHEMRDALIYYNDGPMDRGEANSIVEQFLAEVQSHG